MSSDNGSSDAIPQVLSLIRFSTPEQVAAGKAGIDGQRNLNNASAAFHGVRIRREIVVVDVSGQDVIYNEQFRQLFEELKDPTLSGVLVSEQSRIVRPEGFDDWPILGHFQRNRKLIYTPTGKIDATTPQGPHGAHRRGHDVGRGTAHSAQPFFARQGRRPAGGQASRRQPDAA